MFTILLHSSKTTRTPEHAHASSISEQTPMLTDKATTLNTYMKRLSPEQLNKVMAISSDMAQKVHALTHSWASSGPTLPAIDLFLGDIYSGLQVQSFTQDDKNYANNHLYILSGLYGILRALDEIQPYRLEMGYKLPGNAHDPSCPNITSLYDFWGDTIARKLPKNQDIINLSAVEYTKAVFPYITGTNKVQPIEGHEHTRIITPKFLTVSPKTGEPTFVTVHAKIARGAYARWLIQNRIEDPAKLKNFTDIGYQYDETLSTPEEPVFVAKDFKGLGLSVRLTK